MDISVIIVSWNVKEKLKKNLKALFSGQEGISSEVFVIDNNSRDNSAEMVEKEFPQVKLIANKDNLGFAKANNQAINKSRGKYILLLNPDMRVMPNTLYSMVKWMDSRPEAGVAGCRLVNERGETIPHVRRFPALLDQLAIIFKLPHFFPGVLNHYLFKNFDYSKEAAVDSIRGSFFMIRRETMDKIGGLDERFFIWFEEVDYCRRVKNAGLKVMYTPSASSIDYVGQSISQVSRGAAQKYFRGSMLKYFEKWQPAWQYWILKLAWPVGQALTFLGDKLSIKGRART
ncbi:MAG: glycosyltransferase family 2 protein [Patescibacteria group bacterium]|jgi:hypothetical protein